MELLLFLEEGVVEEGAERFGDVMPDETECVTIHNYIIKSHDQMLVLS